MPQINKILEQPNVLDTIPAHTVKISGNGLTIIGSLQQDIGISFNPEYKKLSELMVIPIQSIESGVAAVSGGQLFDGITTEKSFTGASYIEVSITMRVMDTDGSGAPLLYAKQLAAAAQPIGINDKIAKDAFEDVVEGLEEVGEFIQKGWAKAVKISKDGDEDSSWYSRVYDSITGNNDLLNKIPSEILSSLKDFVANTPLADIEEFLKRAKTIYAKNRVMQVEISDYLCFENMVIESLSQSFSQQQGFNGPLFADFTIQFSTQRVPNSTKVKKFYKTGGSYKSRIEYIS